MSRVGLLTQDGPLQGPAPWQGTWGCTREGAGYVAAAWHGVKTLGRALVSPMLRRLPTGHLGDPEGRPPHNPPAPQTAAPQSDPWALPLPAQHYPAAADGELTARPGPPESPRQAGCSPVCWALLPRPPRVGSQHRAPPRCTGSPVRGRDGPRGGGDMKQPWRQGRDSEDRRHPGLQLIRTSQREGLAAVRRGAGASWGTRCTRPGHRDTLIGHGHSPQDTARPSGLLSGE